LGVGVGAAADIYAGFHLFRVGTGTHGRTGSESEPVGGCLAVSGKWDPGSGNGSRDVAAGFCEGNGGLGCWVAGRVGVRSSLSTKMPQSVFKTNWILSTCIMRGNPYEHSCGKTGNSWQLRDRASWTVFHIQFDKRPIEPLRLRHVHRGYSCGRNIDAVLSGAHDRPESSDGTCCVLRTGPRSA
jgi:hypothetical protein